MTRNRGTRMARTEAIKAANKSRALSVWGPDNLALSSHREDPMAHRCGARSTCHYCAGAWYPEAREARLNDRAAASLADYIEDSM